MIRLLAFALLWIGLPVCAASSNKLIESLVNLGELGTGKILIAAGKDGEAYFFAYRGKKTLIDSVERGYESDMHPGLVPGTVSVDGDGYFAYVVERNSRNSNGQGQCGSGVERELIVLKVGAVGAKVWGRFLIESCLRDMELAVSDPKDWRQAVFWQDGRLHMHWRFRPGVENGVEWVYSPVDTGLSIKELPEK